MYRTAGLSAVPVADIDRDEVHLLDDTEFDDLNNKS